MNDAANEGAVALVETAMTKKPRKGLTIGDQIEVLCRTVAGEQSEATAQELNAELYRLATSKDADGVIMPADADVKIVGRETVRRIRDAIDASRSTRTGLPIVKGVKKKRFGMFRRLVDHLMEEK